MSRQRSASKVSTASQMAVAGAPAAGPYDLPSAAALADLELVPTESRGSLRSAEYRYRGGGGLVPTESRKSIRTKSRENGGGKRRPETFSD